MSNYFGLDIGASTIKVCQAQPMGAQYRLQAIGMASNPTGTIDFSKPEFSAQISAALKQLMKETGIKEKRVVVAVPETHVYSRVIEVPVMSDTELSSAIKWEAEQFVPVPVDQVEMDYTVVKRPPKGSTTEKMLVYLVASQKTYLQSYVDFLVTLGLEPIAVESETIALSRGLAGVTAGSTSLILHVGALSSSLSIVSEGSLFFSYTTPSGGVALTRALSQNLSLPLSQAEQYKRTYGLDKTQLEGKVAQSLLVVLQTVMSEMRKAFKFFSSTYGSEVQKIVLSGGGAYLPDFLSQMSEQFPGIEIVVADPFVNVKPNKDVVVPEERAVYGPVVGLALRTF